MSGERYSENVGKPIVERSKVSLKEHLAQKRDEIAAIAEKRGAKDIRVFGSVARNEEGDSSDIDFLVILEDDRSLFDLAGLRLDLEELLGRDVDVVTPSGLKKRVRNKILEEAVSL